ncbi:MAG: hypothetical protein AAF242_15280 [Bacteroidota bacterium]
MEVIREKLLGWDEKDTDYLLTIYQDGIEDILDPLLELAKDGSSLIQSGSTWLIKHYIDQENKLSPQQISLLSEAIQGFKTWPPQLHYLQILATLEPETRIAEQILPQLDEWIESKVKFVKAWTYYAYGWCAAAIPDIQPEIKTRLEWALQEESASIKVRVRKAIKNFKLST